MKSNRVVVLLAGVLVAFLWFSCAGTPQPSEEAPVAATRPETTPQPETEPAPPAVNDIEPEPPPAAEPEVEETFEVTEELFEQTFSEVERVIGQLNTVIQRRDYRRWLTYLTPEYVAHYSSPETLREISDMPILTRNEIVLRSLEDYFEWVVAPSRANARLDDLTFLNPDQVEAIMVIQGRPAILYRLRNVDGSWKIDVF
ncbi:MAG: hypothetical protein EA403_16960 [Spirochaetaceae bacterium]|nr:MAG: hypothetical protein EA403_16960 [Spirochaetaceae bacterium]